MGVDLPGDVSLQAADDLGPGLPFAGAALGDLHALARGIYPPLLAERGLVMALRTQAARSPVPVLLEADDGAGFPAAATRHGSGLEGMSDGSPRTAAP